MALAPARGAEPEAAPLAALRTGGPAGSDGRQVPVSRPETHWGHWSCGQGSGQRRRDVSSLHVAFLTALKTANSLRTRLFSHTDRSRRAGTQSPRAARKCRTQILSRNDALSVPSLLKVTGVKNMTMLASDWSFKHFFMKGYSHIFILSEEL